MKTILGCFFTFGQWLKRGACLTLLACVPSQASITAINWGGNSVVSTESFADDTGLTTGDDKYGDPHGPFATDASIGGTNSTPALNLDSIAGRALSTTQPFSPDSGVYTGTPFYGGTSVTRTNSLANDGFSELSILNQGSNDSIHYHVDTGGDQHTFHILLYWDQSDFLQGTPSTVDFSGGGSYQLTTSQAAGNHSDHLFRWVVRDGLQFYVSQETTEFTNNGTFTNAFSDLTNWAAFNPTVPDPTADAADLWYLDFDETSRFDVNSNTFTNVTGFGFYAEHEAATGPIHLHIEGITVSVVPEPSTGLLCVLGFGSLFFANRRRRADS